MIERYSRPAMAAIWTDEGKLDRWLAVEIAVVDAWAEAGRLPALAAEIVALKPDVIVAMGTNAALAAKQASSTIPIVALGMTDPVNAGLVSSLGRPDGNVTGNSGCAS